MGALKKTSFMILGSALLFVILSFVDEYELFFPGEGREREVTIDPYVIESTMKRYTENLAKAYIDPTPTVFSGMPVTDELRAELREEIEFLKKDGRILEPAFQSLWVQNISRVAADKVRVSTQETIGVRYLRVKDRSEVRSFPPAVFQMSYVLENDEKGWKIIRYDVEDINEIKAGR